MTTNPTAASVPPNAEFRAYRRGLAVVAAVLVGAGGLWVFSSIAVTLYRRSRAAPTGPTVGNPMSAAEFSECLRETNDVAQALEKHLENFHTLLGGYDQTAAQTWADEGSSWRRRWHNHGERCRLTEAPARELPRDVKKKLEQLAALHEEMGATEASYSRELVRFGQQQAPRLLRIRQRLDQISNTTNPNPNDHP